MVLGWLSPRDPAVHTFCKFFFLFFLNEPLRHSHPPTPPHLKPPPPHPRATNPFVTRTPTWTRSHTNVLTMNIHPVNFTTLLLPTFPYNQVFFSPVLPPTPSGGFLVGLIRRDFSLYSYYVTIDHIPVPEANRRWHPMVSEPCTKDVPFFSSFFSYSLENTFLNFLFSLRTRRGAPELQFPPLPRYPQNSPTRTIPPSPPPHPHPSPPKTPHHPPPHQRSRLTIDHSCIGHNPQQPLGTRFEPSTNWCIETATKARSTQHHLSGLWNLGQPIPLSVSCIFCAFHKSHRVHPFFLSC